MLAQQFDGFLIIACRCENGAADDLHDAVFAFLVC
jgi:hypothetical protein